MPNINVWKHTIDIRCWAHAIVRDSTNDGETLEADCCPSSPPYSLLVIGWKFSVSSSSSSVLPNNLLNTLVFLFVVDLRADNLGTKTPLLFLAERWLSGFGIAAFISEK